MSDIGTHNDHMQMTWQSALDVLKPSAAELEHGLALHRDALVIDTFGFSPKIWTQEIVDTINRWGDEGMGVMEHDTRQTMLRIHGFSEDPAGRAEFVQALDAAGVDALVQTVGGGSSVAGVLKNMAAHRHLCHRSIVRPRIRPRFAKPRNRDGPASSGASTARRLWARWTTSTPALAGSRPGITWASG
jgi:hypothetical protein